jgi:hypothetical protein
MQARSQWRSPIFASFIESIRKGCGCSGGLPPVRRRSMAALMRMRGGLITRQNYLELV